MNAIILETLANFDFDLYRPIKRRSLDLGEPLVPKAGNLVKVITGMRRSGKSYRLFQEMEALHESGVPWERICYFNFEDDRLMPVTSATGDDVLEAFQALNPGAFEEGVYLFFDELQEMEGWGAWLRRIVDTRRVTVYATGSSSKMLSKEISTEFRGRAIDYELLPLSFSEFLAYNEIGEFSGSVAFSTADRLLLQAQFVRYLREGGFPAAQGMASQEAIPLLQSYAQRVVARDVIERHNVAKPRVAAAFTQRVLGTNARQLSVRKVVNDLKSVGIATSREFLGDVLQYLIEAYLVFQVRNFSLSLSESTTSSPKIYAIDPGLALANSRAATSDHGLRLENAVYLELRRRAVGMRKDAITSFRTRSHGYEVDFALGDALDGRPWDLIQVCESMEDDRTAARELRALREAMEESGVDSSVLVVGDGDERTYEQDGRSIRQVPAWKWMLSALG